MNADGTEEARITSSGRSSNFHPDWQPIPNRPPDCSAAVASSSRLAPPNHKLVAVAPSGVTDPDGDTVTLTITGVTQDEPVGDVPDAVTGSAPGQALVRAERNGTGDGRVYRVSFSARDERAGTCTGTVKVAVPKGAAPAVDSAPPSYDSFGS